MIPFDGQRPHGGRGMERLGKRKKKADVAEHPQVFGHVGLLVNEPPGLSRVALYLVVRQLRFNFSPEPNGSPPELRHRLHCPARPEESK